MQGDGNMKLLMIVIVFLLFENARQINSGLNNAENKYKDIATARANLREMM